MCGLVVAGGDGPDLFEFAEEVLDQVTRLIEVAIEVAGFATVWPRRNYRRLARRREPVETRASVSKARLAISRSAAIRPPSATLSVFVARPSSY